MKHYRVSTLELFFDLVFVFTVTQLTVLVANNIAWGSAGQALLLFTVLYWMYGGYAHLSHIDYRGADRSETAVSPSLMS